MKEQEDGAEKDRIEEVEVMEGPYMDAKILNIYFSKIKKKKTAGADEIKAEVMMEIVKHEILCDILSKAINQNHLG